MAVRIVRQFSSVLYEVVSARLLFNVRRPPLFRTLGLYCRNIENLDRDASGIVVKL